MSSHTVDGPTATTVPTPDVISASATAADEPKPCIGPADCARAPPLPEPGPGQSSGRGELWEKVPWDRGGGGTLRDLASLLPAHTRKC